MSAALEAADLVAQTRRRVIEFFDMWTDVDATVLSDFESMLDDFRAAADLAARARALAEFVEEMRAKLNRISQETAP